MVRVTRFHRRWSFGSKTTHWVAASMDDSTMMNSRRTLMYFQLGSLDRVRAPQMRMPPPCMVRMALMPLGLSRSCSPRETLYLRPSAPRTSSLAGALWTPRSLSTRE
jgi:hypothetical protein